MEYDLCVYYIDVSGIVNIKKRRYLSAFWLVLAFDFDREKGNDEINCGNFALCANKNRFDPSTGQEISLVGH